MEDLGNFRPRQCDLDRLCKRMQSKGSRVRFVYEAGPCGYAVYRYLTGKGFDCTVCAPSKTVVPAGPLRLRKTIEVRLLTTPGSLRKFTPSVDHSAPTTETGTETVTP